MIYRRFFGLPGFENRNPFSEIENMRRQVERLYQGFMSPYTRPAAGVFPLINLTESKDEYTLRAELPGVNSEDLDIQATANTLSLTGERKIPDEKDGARYHRRERESGRFSRVITLPGEINPDKVEAGLVNGVLTVVVPKAEASKPRQITVR
ncbi:MAG: Hsp20/alpha crystallin family protein [Desulfobacterales bacterium]